MADAAILTKVKNALGITSTYMDETISIYIDEVVFYMENAGMTDAMISASAGLVTRGVADLWNNSAGQGKLSPYFYDAVTQRVLCSKKANCSYSVYIPKDDASAFGWLTTAAGKFVKNMMLNEFHIKNDDELIASVKFPDGSVKTDTNNALGDVREVSFDGKTVTIATGRIYSVEESKFVESGESTAVMIDESLAGCEILLEAYSK